MLPQWIEKIKAWVSEYTSDLFIALLIFLTGLASFGLGRLSVIWPRKEPVEVFRSDPSAARGQGSRNGGDARRQQRLSGNIGSSSPVQIPDGKGQYVASKSGSVYHFPWCPGALHIKEDNKVWFATAEDARKKGYQPAQNCPGL